MDLTILPIKESGDEQKLKKPIHPNLPNIATGQLGLMISPVSQSVRVLFAINSRTPRRQGECTWSVLVKGLRWHDAWDWCVCVCVSTVQPESWSCCLQMLIDGNRLRSGGVLVLFWLFS